MNFSKAEDSPLFMFNRLYEAESIEIREGRTCLVLYSAEAEQHPVVSVFRRKYPQAFFLQPNHTPENDDEARNLLYQICHKRCHEQKARIFVLLDAAAIFQAGFIDLWYNYCMCDISDVIIQETDNGTIKLYGIPGNINSIAVSKQPPGYIRTALVLYHGRFQQARLIQRLHKRRMPGCYLDASYLRVQNIAILASTLQQAASSPPGSPVCMLVDRKAFGEIFKDLFPLLVFGFDAVFDAKELCDT